jgi:sortase A
VDRKLILRIAALVSGISGVVILVGVIYPIISYNSTFTPKYNQLISPVSEKSLGAMAAPSPNPDSASTALDYTQASNWFPSGVSKENFTSTKVEYFTVTIPKLKIDKATVAIGGEDLSSHIIQYPGTALPGKRGNSVLFGHSILPIFYNPKNYLSIFSLLPTLNKGDEIEIDYDGVSYKYRVETMFEVRPTDLQVLDQDSSDSFLTLVTCTPPGDPGKPKRLIVRARVVPPDQS